MHFLRENVTFHDAVNMIHDVITTANPSAHLINSYASPEKLDPFQTPTYYSLCLLALEIIKPSKSDAER